MEEKKIAHLGFIEATIERMANNSAAIKGWSMGIVAAIIGLGVIGKGKTDNLANWILFGCSCIIVFIMWCLDAFYLYQEKLFRDLYSLVRVMDEKDINYSMDARRKTIIEKKGKAVCYFSVLKNRTILPFYLPQLVINFLFFILPIIIEAASKQ